MTISLHLPHRAAPTQPINHSAYVCDDCQAVPQREHGPACPAVAAQGSFLRYLLDDLKPLFYVVGLVVTCLLLWAIVAAPIAFLIWS